MNTADEPHLVTATAAPAPMAETQPTDAAPILLGAYAAITCPVKTYNTFDPTAHLPQSAGVSARETASVLPTGASRLDPPPKPPDFRQAAVQFETAILEQFIAVTQGQVADLRLLGDKPRSTQIEACVTAMRSGAAVIIGGCLPVDLTGHRVGYPDLLIRGSNRDDGHPGYHPAEVKWHKVIERSPAPRLRPRTAETTENTETAGPLATESPSAVRCSTIERPSPADASILLDHGFRLGSRSSDLIQLAHYHRMLQSCGFAAEPALGAVIGTDTLTQTPTVVWMPLDEPLIRTFSRETDQGWQLRTALERYDGEQEFRIAIAEAARARGREVSVEPPLVTPIVIGECRHCPWWEHCLPQLHPDDISLRIDKGALDRREISALRRRGISTIDELVASDLGPLLDGYLPEVAHRSGAEERLRAAQRRAQMLLDDTSFVRETSGEIAVPGAAVEIDFDIESSADGRIYLWGFLINSSSTIDSRSGPGTAYREFSRFDDLDDAGEAALAVEAFTWLRSMVEAGESVAVYHYSSYEVTKINELTTREDHPILTWAAGYAAEKFVDLLEIVKLHFFGVNGLGLKLIATHAGFRWRDSDPGGLNSQVWFDEAVRGSTDSIRDRARQRVLDYNEDDVVATQRLRAWLRAQ